MDIYVDCPQYLSDYLHYLSTIKNRSELTIKNYYCDIRLFLRFLKIKNKLVDSATPIEQIKIFDLPEDIVKQVTLYDALEFLHFTSEDLSNKSKARARKAVALRRFFSYLTDVKMWFTVSPVQKLQLPSPNKSLPKHLTVEQSIDLLNTCSDIKNWQDMRDYCIITFLLNCGMRLSELVGINVNDIISTKDYDSGLIVHYLKVLGKGSKERIIYLNDACFDAFERYIEVRPNDEKSRREKALFLSKQLKRISNRRVEQIIDEKMRSTGLADMGFSVHKLRHTAATLMYQNGVDVRVLKEVLGHENLDTTQIYTHVADKQLKDAVYHNPLAENKLTKK